MRSISLAFAVAASALGAGTAAATPFDARTIPEQVDGVGHVDVDALRRTQLFGALGGQAALDVMLDDAPAEVRAIAKSLSRSIRAVSFWYDDEHGALQVATNDARALGQLLTKVPVKQARTVDGHGVFVVDKGGKLGKGRFRWTETIRAGDLTARVAAELPEIGRVKALVPKQRGVSGRIGMLAIEGDRGTAEVSGDLRIRRLLGGLKSTLFEVHREGDAFDIREFHRRALDVGGVGLDTLRAAVLR